MSDTVKSLLIALQAQLKQLSLWCDTPPDQAAMASSMPFCYDTMPLEQWLQFIFIPRMHVLLDTQSELPNKISVLPVAEHAFDSLGPAAAPLLAIIQQLDITLSGDV